MEPDSPNILPYAPPPKRFHSFRLTRRTLIFLAAPVLLVLIVQVIATGRTSGQIRLDSGDLRHCWYGIPIRYDRMPEPQRTRLLSLASRAPVMPARWVTCVKYPLSGSNNPDRMCRDFYWFVAVWEKEDPRIARYALDDVVAYIAGTKATSGLPDSFGILSPSVIDWRTDSVDPAWRDMGEVKDYCTLHGYTPPPKPKP